MTTTRKAGEGEGDRSLRGGTRLEGAARWLAPYREKGAEREQKEPRKKANKMAKAKERREEERAG